MPFRLFRRRVGSPEAEVSSAAEAAEAAAVAQAAAEVEESGAAEFEAHTAERTAVAVERTRRSWFGRVSGLFGRGKVDQALWEELEEALVGSDVGLRTTERLLDRVRERVEQERLRTPDEVRGALRDELIGVLAAVPAKGTLWAAAQPPVPPAVVLVVGVNGVGKTTSIAKLANAFKQDGGKVIIAAGDTFRAAAIEQLQVWGERLDIEVIAQRPGSDPAAVVYDAHAAAAARHADALIVDTAGRLHTKVNLMEELGKVRRILQRRDPEAPHEVLLVIDATTGQNGLSQAREFARTVDVTGIFLTKLDGTAKGGIAFAIAAELGIPIRFIGVGERPGDIAPFDAEQYVDALLALPASTLEAV